MFILELYVTDTDLTAYRVLIEQIELNEWRNLTRAIYPTGTSSIIYTDTKLLQSAFLN